MILGKYLDLKHNWQGKSDKTYPCAILDHSLSIPTHFARIILLTAVKLPAFMR